MKDKAIKEGEYYSDSKYICMAGNIMWNGCFFANKKTFVNKKNSATTKPFCVPEKIFSLFSKKLHFFEHYADRLRSRGVIL